jgi:hypothetical protein
MWIAGITISATKVEDGDTKMVVPNTTMVTIILITPIPVGVMVIAIIVITGLIIMMFPLLTLRISTTFHLITFVIMPMFILKRRGFL